MEENCGFNPGKFPESNLACPDPDCGGCWLGDVENTSFSLVEAVGISVAGFPRPDG